MSRCEITVDGNRTPGVRSASVGPSTSSMTAPSAIALLEAVNLRDVRVVQRRQDFGFRWNRASRSGRPPADPGNTLMATRRFRLVSVAL